VVYNLMCADVPRGVQLELVRHRVGVAYSWESTRFTDRFLRFVVPLPYRDDPEALVEYRAACEAAAAAYLRLKARALARGAEGTLARKRAMEAARDVLGSGLGSDGLFTVNAREARYVIGKRTAEAAAQGIRELAHAVYEAVSIATRPLRGRYPDPGGRGAAGRELRRTGGRVMAEERPAGRDEGDGGLEALVGREPVTLGHRSTVLLVDDDVSIRNMVRRILEGGRLPRAAGDQRRGVPQAPRPGDAAGPRDHGHDDAGPQRLGHDGEDAGEPALPPHPGHRPLGRRHLPDRTREIKAQAILQKPFDIDALTRGVAHWLEHGKTDRVVSIGWKSA
jgi:hypothetical protein